MVHTRSRATNDFAPTISASQIVYDDVQSPYSFPDPSADPTPMIADIQMWLDNPATNFGSIFICESEDVPSTARRFGSREDPNFPPQLTIQYLVPAHIDQAQRVGNQFNLSFTALPGQNYAVQISDAVPASSWQPLANVAAPPVVTRDPGCGERRRRRRRAGQPPPALVPERAPRQGARRRRPLGWGGAR